MRNLKIYSLLALVFLVSSCDGDFDDINVNPLEPSDVADGALYNSIVSSLRLGWNRQLFLHNEILYDVTEQAVVTAQTFGNVSGGAEDVWSNYYTALKNANELYSRFSALEDPEIGNVMKAQIDILMAFKTFQLTDLFGDVPFSEAGQAFAERPIIQAQYDSQEDIYKTLLDNLRDASAILTGGGQTSLGNNYARFSNFETLYNDDLGRWVRLSNSLQFRYLLRMYEKDPSFVEPRVQSLIENTTDVLVQGQDAVMMPRDQMWSNLGVNWSFREHNKVRMGSTVWDFMTDEDEIIDPRAYVFFEPNVNGDWQAFPQISDASTVQSGGQPYQQDIRDGSFEDKGEGNIYSAMNYYLVRDEKDIPEILMSSAEVKFIKAEIFLRGIGVTPDPFLAKSNYELGMVESFQFWQGLMNNSEVWVNKADEFMGTDFFSAVLHPKYAIDPAGDVEANLKKIYAQRWMDNFRQPWEAYSLLRRTNMVPRTKDENNFHRFKYPPSEFTLNTDNYNSQSSEMGGDENNIKVWWADY